jgi:hypothetical protein
MNQTPDQFLADLMADTVAFPVLSAVELAECPEFGTRCSFAAGEELFGAGSQTFDCYVIVSGDVCIMDVSTDEPTCIVPYGAGQFTGDIDLFTGRPARSVPVKLPPWWKLSASRLIESVRCWCASQRWEPVFGALFSADASC